ncbi:substrate-binding periplasmic protein [Pseudomonas sp. PDM13]|uniref:substrate-binding periplasmic protein n=1 Tax=Pseudomonas sp. PDM13 TaxID=2769255 RepID=UPI0021DF4E19|nr:ABC transporter substrate-binding protein [Pseudomonas sp. PDM13]MCU9946432.1 transporter substrate-binding domain-containing protein [Pseudomonas sp. PDM13]
MSPSPLRTVPPLRRLLFALALLLPAASLAETLQIGAEDDWYPFTAFRDGAVRGMSVEIVQAAFAAADTPVELVPYPYSRCMQLALQGKLAGCFNTAPDARIAEAYRLPRHPLFRDDILLWSRVDKAAPVDDLQRLEGARVAVTIGYEYGAPFEALRGLERVPVRKDINGFLMLQHGRVDYVVAYRATTAELLREYPELVGAFQAVGTVHRPELFLSFSRRAPGAEQLLQRFDQGMQRIQEDGRYQAILDRWQYGEPIYPAD